MRTRDVAAAAGVSEALLFRHFPTKEDLICAVMDAQGHAARMAQAAELLRSQAPRQALIELAARFFETIQDQSERTRLSLFATLEFPIQAEAFYRDYAEPLLRAEADVFRRAAQERLLAGDTRPAPDPEVAARAFHGTLMFYNLRLNVFRAEHLPDDRTALAKSVVDLFLPEVQP